MGEVWQRLACPLWPRWPVPCPQWPVATERPLPLRPGPSFPIPCSLFLRVPSCPSCPALPLLPSIHPALLPFLTCPFLLTLVPTYLPPHPPHPRPFSSTPSTVKSPAAFSPSAGMGPSLIRSIPRWRAHPVHPSSSQGTDEGSGTAFSDTCALGNGLLAAAGDGAAGPLIRTRIRTRRSSVGGSRITPMAHCQTEAGTSSSAVMMNEGMGASHGE